MAEEEAWLGRCRRHLLLRLPRRRHSSRVPGSSSKVGLMGPEQGHRQAWAVQQVQEVQQHPARGALHPAA